ncbi:cyclase family protein, partial [Achromobacter xylosoxidans]
LSTTGTPRGALWGRPPRARGLRANGRHRFLFPAPPLRRPGAAGSPATPIATV